MKNYIYIFTFLFTSAMFEGPLNEHERLTEIWQDYSEFIKWTYEKNDSKTSCDFADWSINPLIQSWYSRNCKTKE